jgi:hypothetical protein
MATPAYYDSAPAEAPAPTEAAAGAPAPTLIPPIVETEPPPTAVPLPPPEIPEERQLVLEWPEKIRVGDSDVIRVTLEVNEDNTITPTAIIAGHETRGEPVQIPNLYATHNVFAEASLDVTGLEISPASEIVEPMRPGRPVSFYWSVRPDKVGSLRGLVWVHLHFIPISEGLESRIPLTAQVLDIEAVNFLGLGGNGARLFGVLGSLVGSVLGLDNVISWVWKLFRRRSQKNERR